LWKAGEPRFSIERRDPPYGFVLLDTGTGSVSFIPVELTRKVVEVSVETSGLTLSEVKQRFDKILEKVGEAMVFPEIHGTVTFPLEALEQYLKEKGGFIGELDSKNAEFALLGRGEIKVPQLPNVSEIIREQVSKAVKELGPHLDVGNVISAFLRLLEDGRLTKPSTSPSNRLRELLFPVLEKVIGQKPKFFLEDAQEIFQVVRKVKR
ncbi:MAG: hypothetical protein QW356_07585, partial [Candidatus Hadarchaeales archaeon]